MALVFINGFDDNMHSGTAVGGMAATFDTTVFRTGSAAAKMAGNGSAASGTAHLFVPIPGGGDATVIVGQAVQWNNTTGAVLLACFLSDNGATIHVSVVLNPSTGVITAYRGSSTGAVLGTANLSGSAILTNTWGYWETKATLSDTVGEVHVRYNGAAVLDVTGADTKNAGTKTVIDSVDYPEGFNSGTLNIYNDDLYIVTGTGAPNDFLGDCKVNTVYPNGNGDFSQLVGSDADSVNNYLLVNEAGAPVTTSYAESSTAGQRDFYTMGDISIPATSTVLGVQVSGWVNNPDAGSGRSAILGVRQGTSEGLSAAQPLTAATFLAVRGVFTVDPATGAAWTQTGVNSAQAGMQVN